MIDELKSVSITREDLYEKVWQTPLTILAKEFGLSDKGLAKICAKLNVPCPGRGYWRKLQTGAVTEKAELPAESKKTCITIRARRLKKAEREPELKPILVPEELQNPHSLVVEAKKAFAAKKRDEVAAPVLDLRVAKDSENRALIIMDTLIKELEQQGAKVIVKKYRETVAAINGEEIKFYIEERSERIPEAEIKPPKRGRFAAPQEQFRRTGKLVLTIDSYSDNLRRIFSDGKKQKVEGLLPEFIHTLGRFVEKSKAQKEERRISALEQAVAQEARELEQTRVAFLKEDIDRFEYAVRLKRYLRVLKRTPKIEDEWLKWVENYLHRLERREVSSPDRKASRYESRTTYGGW